VNEAIDLNKSLMEPDDFTSDEAKVMWRLISKYNLIVTLDGIYVDSVTSKQMRRNPLRCMLRNDYKEAGYTQYHGKALDVLINIFLDSLVSASNKVYEQTKNSPTPYVKYIGDVMVSESFL
jgi:hypothetical protein